MYSHPEIMITCLPVEVVPLAAEEVVDGTVAVLQKPCWRGQVEGHAAFLASDFQAACTVGNKYMHM